MFTVMLVDDEQILREGIRKFVPWEAYGFQVKFEAASGFEAIEIIRKHHIDLLIIDIRMPGMSGLEVLAQIADVQRDMHVVILSGYNEFDYAREAMRYQVTDYLLKPVKPSEVSELLVRIAQEKEQSRKKQAERIRADQQLIEMDWFRLLNEMNDNDTAQALIHRLASSYEHAAFKIAMLPASSGYVDTNREEVVASFRSLAGVEGVFAVERPDYGVVLLLVLANASSSPSGVRTNEKDYWLEESKDILQRTPVFQSIVYSSRFTIATAGHYLTAGYLAHMELRIFYSVERISFMDKPDSTSSPPFVLDETFVRKFKELAGAESLIHLRQKLSELYFMLTSAQPLYSPDSVREAYRTLLKRVYPLMHSNQEWDAKREPLLKDRADLRLKTLHDDAIRTLERWFLRMEDRMKDTRRRLIKEITNYVQEHLAEPVMLIDLAAHFRVSVEYLSQLFKKEEGINFNQYLRQARMTKAKEILDQDCSMKIYELALQVGYSDAKHFSKVFRETNGMTPREYIERIQ